MIVKRFPLPAVILSLGIFVGLLPLLRTHAHSVPDTVNTKVKPGDVVWHESFATACEASKQSGRPVLLFQLMGKLDDQFC
jgi:hypothetical protein